MFWPDLFSSVLLFFQFSNWEFHHFVDVVSTVSLGEQKEVLGFQVGIYL